MKLRSHAGSNLDQTSQKIKVRCHLCRNKNSIKISLTCSSSPDCKRGFCFACIKSHFSSDPHSISPDHWICYVCRGLCNCTRCQERIKDDIKKLKAVQEIEDKIEDAGDTLFIKEWRKGAMLANEKEFKGPKTYPKIIQKTNEPKKPKAKKPKVTRKTSSKVKRSSSEESEFIPDKKTQMELEINKKNKKFNQHGYSEEELQYSAGNNKQSSPVHKKHEKELLQSSKKPANPNSPPCLSFPIPATNGQNSPAFSPFQQPGSYPQYPYYYPYSYMYSPYMNPNSYMSYPYQNDYLYYQGNPRPGNPYMNELQNNTNGRAGETTGNLNGINNTKENGKEHNEK